jgi:hypothetical protein
MSTLTADFSKYSTILFMDSMVALEGKPLPILPWHEIDSTGPILVLVVPQVNAEIDKRKRDGRLGKRAREFNRLIGPAAETGMPVCILEGPPAVDIAIAVCERINWDELQDLDPDEPDARIVAQILFTRGIPPDRKLLFSQDINPIAMASRHRLKSQKMPEHWLLEPEPSPNEKELSRLKSRLKELESTEPDIVVDLKFGVDARIQLYQIRPLSNNTQHDFADHILEDNPKTRQDMIFHDYSYNDRYEKYRDNIIPRHVAEFHRRLEIEYSQIPFTVSVRNIGHIQAENLVIKLTAVYGGLHDRFRYYPPHGPIAPEPKNSLLMRPMPSFNLSHLKQMAGRHEMEFAVGPDGGDILEVHCADFRHGREWIFEGVARIDPHSASPFRIQVEITASNFRGSVARVFEIEFLTKTVEVADLIDIKNRKRHIEIPMSKQFNEALEAENASWFEFLGGDDNDD